MPYLGVRFCLQVLVRMFFGNLLKDEVTEFFFFFKGGFSLYLTEVEVRSQFGR